MSGAENLNGCLPPRLVPGTGGEVREFANGKLVRTFQMGIFVESNQSVNCLSLRCVDQNEDEDLIHICDWPVLRQAVDEYVAERHRLAGPDAW